MSTEALYGLNKSDEQIDLELRDAGPEEILKATYRAWFKNTKKIRGTASLRYIAEPLYQEACRIMRPFKDRLRGTLKSERIIKLIAPKFYDTDENRCMGPYLSAVLNETNVKKLMIDDIAYLDYVGYHLKPGKSVETVQRTDVKRDFGDFGELAECGTIINRFRIDRIGSHATNLKCVNHGGVKYLGNHAKDGEWINYNRAEHMGEEAMGGVWTNKGVAEKLGEKAKNGTFINECITDSMGAKASGGIFINRGKRGRSGSHTGMGHQASGDVYINYTHGCDMGFMATGGVHINLGRLFHHTGMGHSSKDGIYINLGQIDGRMAAYAEAKNGIYINCGKIEGNMGNEAHDGVFITKTEPKKGFLKDLHDTVYGVGPSELEKNGKLSKLVARIEKASKEADVPRVEKLARRIDSHVRKDYKPRRVA